MALSISSAGICFGKFPFLEVAVMPFHTKCTNPDQRTKKYKRTQNRQFDKRNAWNFRIPSPSLP